ncbi:MAG: ABC transporter ATP-binding protein [Phycisphaerae bacterium]
MSEANGQTLLRVDDLRTSFFTDTGVVPAVDGVSWSVPRGGTVALVGESGCGKSVTALSIMRLIADPGRIVGGAVVFDDGSGDGPVDLLTLSERRMRSIRGNRIAMIFQEPMTSLNPVYSVGDQIVEAIELHRGLRGRAAWAAAVDMLDKVGIPAAQARARAYPHEMSGGMRQRVMIAMALACAPSLLIADEPTTALDVTIQAQILTLLRSLRAEFGMSVVIITHDLGVVAQLADSVCVMYAGRIVERAPVCELFAHPLHPYTQGLMRCIPRLSTPQGRLEVIGGAVPDPRRLPRGCRFHPRCRLTSDRAAGVERRSLDPGPTCDRRVLRRCVDRFPEEPSGSPSLRELRPDHFVACWEV